MKRLAVAALALAVLAGLYFSSLYSFLLFHSLVELFSVVIAFGIFMVAWNSRDFIGNNYLLFIGTAYFFVGSLDLTHTLAYKGMNIFAMPEANLAAQFWIAGRYLESMSLLLAPVFIRKRVNPHAVFVVYFVVTAGVFISIFGYDVFPVSFVEGTGLTAFKVMSEYIIITMLIAAVFALIRQQEAFDAVVLKLIVTSIFCDVVSELVLTFYMDVYGFSNLLGHYFKLASYYLIYHAMIKTGLEKPYSIILRDLKKSEERLIVEKNRAEAYLNMAGVIFMIIDTLGKIILVNRRGCEMLGAHYGEIVGKDWFDTFVPAVDRKKEHDFFARFISGNISGVEYRESAIIAGGERQRIIAWHNTLLKEAAGEVTGMLVSGEDITDRIEYEKALEKYQGELELLVHKRTKELERTNSQLIAMTKKLTEAENIERQRIARELHDLIGQNLTALGLNLNIMKTKLTGEALEALGHRINDSLLLVEETTVNIRDVMARLRPPVLDDYGLFTAVNWLSEQLRKRTGVNIEVVGEEFTPRLDMHVETALFRIVQEALNNVVKHSEATSVTIVLKRNGKGVMLIIEDNGIGFDKEKVAPSQRSGKWGLTNIYERAISIGGCCNIESVPGSGTRIIVEVSV